MVTHQLQVERRTGKVRRPETDVLPLCHATNSMTVTDKLQRVLNAAARVITGTRGLGQILHDQTHWLDVPDRVLFKLAVTVHQCLNGRAPPYLSEHCIPVSSADTRRHLRSANRHLLAVPCFRLNTYDRRAFSVAGPMAWTSLPDFIQDPTNRTDCFRFLLKLVPALLVHLVHYRGS